MGAIKEHSNQIIKILICLCLTLTLIFVQPKENVQQAEAIVPILLWGGGILAGVVAEEMLEMGIKHVTTDGKTAKKGKAGKIADAVLDNLDSYDFDNTNPTRRADGSLDVNLSPNDRAKIARKIADEFGDVIEEETLRRSDGSKPTYTVNSDDVSDPYYGGGVSIDVAPSSTSDTGSIKANEYFEMLTSWTFTPVAYEKKTVVKAFSVITGQLMLTSTLPGGNYHLSVSGNTINTNVTYTTDISCFTANNFYGQYPTSGSPSISRSACDLTTVKYYQNYLRVLEMNGAKIYTSKGMVVPSTLKNVYPVGDDYDGQILPNRQELSNKPYKIKNFFPVGSSDEDVSWETVQNHYDTDVINNQTKIDNEYETYLENGDINNTTYNTQTINNYYTDTNYPVKSEDIKIEIDIDNDVVVTNPDDDDSTTGTGGLTKVEIDVDGFKHCVDKSTGTVVPCKDIEGIDGGLLAYLRDSYNYAVNAVKTAVNGLETIATGSVGLIALYSEIFDWLPDEVTVLLTSGLMLMIGLRVFRK